MTLCQVVAAAGAVEHEELVNLASKQFANLPTDSTTAEELVAAEPAIFTGSDVRLRDPESKDINLAIAFKGAAWSDPDSVPLMVIQTLLGGWNKGLGTGEFPDIRQCDM